MMVHAVTPADDESRLPGNIMFFARALRAAGLPVGPASVVDAVKAVEAVGLGARADLHATLHAVLVKQHEHSFLFDQMFDLFWRKRGFAEKANSLMSPASDRTPDAVKPQPGAQRVADALALRAKAPQPKSVVEADMRLTMSADEVLQHKDFAQMSAEEIARAMAVIAKLRLPKDSAVSRRTKPDPRGRFLDARASLRKSLRHGGHNLELAKRARQVRPVPIVALCDISGSMRDYTQVFLQFMHGLSAKRSHVHTFLFGTRLTNVTRALRAKDADVALGDVAACVEDWSGGTRIGTSLHAFNRLWARRVLGQGALVLLFTDGLERDGVAELAHDMERLHKSSRTLIWLNPLLRFDQFEPKAQGIRAILPHVDAFCPVHNLVAMSDLCAALEVGTQTGQTYLRQHAARAWLTRT